MTQNEQEFETFDEATAPPEPSAEGGPDHEGEGVEYPTDQTDEGDPDDSAETDEDDDVEEEG